MSTTDSLLEAPRILPIPANVPRPLWSVMIPAFNCDKYLPTTIRSVLAQDPGPDQMQIEIIDDCSTKDDPQKVVREIGNGRVAFHRKPQNGGVTANFNTCLERSRGHLIHILHGNDYVMPGFYQRISETAAAHPDLAVFFTRCFKVDEEGTLDTLLYRVPQTEKPTRDPGDAAYINPYQTPGVVIRRSFYETHGGFLPSLTHVADWEMWIRAIALGGALGLNEPLASYRIFATNDTGRLIRTGENIRDALRFGEVMARRFPDYDAARFNCILSHNAFTQARMAQQRGDTEAEAANLKVWREITPWPDRLKMATEANLRRMFGKKT